MAGFENDVMFAKNADFTQADNQAPTESNGLATNGQLWIGTTSVNAGGTHLNVGTLTSPNATVSLGYSSPNITLDVVGGGFKWTDVTTATQALAVQNGYLTDRSGGVTYTLPATAAIGDTIKLVGKLGLTIIAQNANQQILLGSASSTVGISGSISGTNVGDCAELICITSGTSTVWRVDASIGNWTVT